MSKKTVIEQMIGLLRTPIAQRKGIIIPPDECLIWADELEKELKSLPERFNLQPKQEWSEEDELQMQGIIDLLPGLTIRHNWLKSLKGRVQPQRQWKPTEEQLKFLQHYADQNNYDGTILTSLLNDLKKLK